MRIPFLDLKLQYEGLKAELAEEILRALDSAQYIEGPAVKDFERQFAAYCGTAECVALDSGTAALQLTLLALDIGPGDEVVVPTNTFIATAAAVAMVGAKVVPVDSDLRTWLMDPNRVEGKITPRTKAVIAVHLYGQPVQMDAVTEICRRKGVHLIEDAAQAQGARYKNRRCGGLAEIACFSFYPAKNLGAYGDGGAATTNNVKLANRIRLLANHGRGASRYEHAEVGYNLRMDEIQGVVLRHKLRKLDGWNDKRRELAQGYRARLSAAPVEFYEVPPECHAIYHLMAVGVDDPQRLQGWLAEHTIDSGFHYPIPVHLQPAFKFLGYEPGDMPVAERIARRTISLPIFPEMTESQLDYVCEVTAAGL